MIKKISIGLLIAALIGLISYLGYNKYQSMSSPQANAIQAIPTNAALIIKSKQWSKTWDDLEKASIWQQLRQSEDWTSIEEKLGQTQASIQQSEELQKLLDNQTVYLSVHAATQDYHLLLATAFRTTNVIELLKQHFIQSRMSTREYDGVTIYQLEESPWSLCVHQGTLFASTSPLLVEHSIRQLNNQHSLLDIVAFDKVQQTESTFADAHLYVNYPELAKFLEENGAIVNSKHLNRWAEWAELDLKIKDKNLLLSGFTLAQDSSANYLNALNGQQPQELNLDAILPSNTASMSFLGISDFNTYYEKYKEYLAEHNNLYEHNKWIQDKEKAYDIHLENTFKAIIGSELACLSTRTASGNEAHYALIKTNEETINIFDHLNTAIKEEIYQDSHRGYELKKFNISHSLPKMLGPVFKEVTENYYTWMDGYLVFANSSKELKTFINNFLSRKTLQNNSYYQSYSELVSSKCNFLYYSNPSLGNWSDKVNDDWNSLFPSENWDKINAFAYQLSANNELFYNNLVLHYQDQIQNESQLLWSYSLGSSFRMQPQFITNHYTQLQEVLVQDDEQTVHLISTNGSPLWKRKIGGKILGEVQQIDRYKNNKLQILFNTRDSLYLLDRNGRHVEDFPVALKSSATAGLTLVDYDKNRKYRILIPCEDKVVYNYDKEGSIVKGWKFKAMPNRISQSPIYHLHKSKDFIYVVDDAGQAKIVGRNGKERVKIGQIPLADSFHIDPQHGYIYSTDAQANVWLTDLEGKSSQIKTSGQAAAHRFVAENINQDDLTELLIAQEGRLSCYQLEAELFSYSKEVDYGPFCFNNGEEKVIGLSSGENIILLKANGEEYPGMPLYGQGLFNCADMDKDEKLNLLVGSGDLLYNYSLE
jgi:hypothetical protein